MSTINTMEDLIQVLDENPEWVEALRARLLTPELLDLPQTFAKFVVEMNRFVEATNKQFEAIDRRLDEHTARLDSLDASVQKLRNDIAPLKGDYARNAALKNASLIARHMGLRRSKSLSQDDLLDLTDAADTTGIPSNQIDSFHLADLIMEARNQEQETCYIAMEISFTVNGRDTTRAIRNAEFLARFTGKRTYAAIAGLYQDNRIQEYIESGQVFWYQLSLRDMEAE